jgi:hypothetical protein
LTFEALMSAGMANGQNKNSETIDIVMLLLIWGGWPGNPGCMRLLLNR